MSPIQTNKSNAYRNLTHRSSKLLRVPIKPTGKAQAMIKPIVAPHEITFRHRISKAPSSRLRHTISFGLASIHLDCMHKGWDHHYQYHIT